jgi:hypothetical protein
MSFTERSASRRAPLAVGLTLILALAWAPYVGAEQSGDVLVFASVRSVAQSLILTICDTIANFGASLAAAGTAPTGTEDTVRVSHFRLIFPIGYRAMNTG